jgi:uncharacterized membrane protein
MINIPLPFQRFIRSRPHLVAALLLGGLLGLVLPAGWTLLTRFLVCWNAGVWAYLVTMGWMMMRANHQDVKRMAARQDERSPMILAALCAAAIASLVAIISQLSELKDLPANDRALHYGFVIITLLGSWFLVGTIFCVHYAHLYYNDEAAQPPLTFPEPQLQPDYWDFLYFSFTISVAVQTSDVTVHSREMRKVVLGQSVMCFFFNLAILGLSINIAASLINN